jgi:hypothetical protein
MKFQNEVPVAQTGSKQQLSGQAMNGKIRTRESMLRIESQKLNETYEYSEEKDRY